MVRSVDVEAEAVEDRVEGPNRMSVGIPNQATDTHCFPVAPPGLQTAGYAAESSSKLWSVYLTESECHDKALAESWKNDMDGLLIFVSHSTS